MSARSRAWRGYGSAYDSVLRAVPLAGSDPAGVVVIARAAGVIELTARKHLATAVGRGDVVRTGHPNVRYLYVRSRDAGS